MAQPANSWRRLASACVQHLARRAARSYVAGPTLADALRVAGQLAGRGHAVALGYWDGAADTPRGVADQYLADLDRLSSLAVDGYEAIKLPALGGSRDLVDEVLARAAQLGRRVHFDSIGPDSADAAWDVIARAAGANLAVSGTLPGRWRRSLDDAERAIALGVVVRVVKGQSVDPAFPHRDPAAGFEEVVGRLAGRARHVAVATHNPRLADAALGVLQAAGTSCELELLYGLPWRAAVEVARRRGVAVRFYVPFGEAYLPYCLSQARRHPVLLWQLLKDACRGYCRPWSAPPRLLGA